MTIGLDDALAWAGTEASAPTVHVIQTVLTLASLILNNGTQDYPPSANVSDGDCFDFIIVGGGAAGCVLANRLTEVPDWKVLLVEAGDDPTMLSDKPALFPFTARSTMDWGFGTDNDGRTAQGHQNKNVLMSRGKALGGSTAINYMMYVRGNENTFNSWVEMGNPGWGWDNATYYFKKSEKCEDMDLLTGETASYHSSKGYLGLTRLSWDPNTAEIAKAFVELGHEIHNDTNGPNQMGYSAPSVMAADGIRQGAGVAFIKPIKDRSNLYILKNTLARKVILDENNKATGVEVQLSDDSIINLFAEKEVIVSAGAIKSPQLLLLSGIGDEDHLNEMNITVKYNSPNVGQNAQDHMIVLVPTTGQENLLSAVYNVDPYINVKTFPGTIVMGFTSLNKSSTNPQYQTTMFPTPAAPAVATVLCDTVFELEKEACAKLTKTGLRKNTHFTVITYLQPDSRGQIKLKTCDPEDHPSIITGWFSNTTNDLENYALFVEDYLNVLNTTYFKSVNAEVMNLGIKQCSDYEFATHEYWKCYILNTANTQFHLAGTCKMGPDGVVNEELKVYGTEALRVVDLSIAPLTVTGNTCAVTYMIAEKAADMIKSDHGVTVEYLDL